MFTIEELGTNVPAFLVKLWKIVEDPESNDLISWSPAGTSFFIRNQGQFARELLPLYFKHNNLASFVRQLNMYGFHKLTSIEGGGLKPDRDEMEFSHQCFLMGHPYLLEHIKRKVTVTKLSVDENVAGAAEPELVKKVLKDVKSLQGRQENVNSQLSEMKRENEVLWREVAVLRQKHLKQQQIVNKLIQFLVSMVHTSRTGGMGIKRHYPYMLSHLPHPRKAAKISAEELLANSPGGPIIHELDATDLLEDDTPTSEEVTTADEYLDRDLHTDEGAECLSPHSSMGSMDDLAAAVNTSSPEVLLELAEECSLGQEMFAAPDLKSRVSAEMLKAKSRKSTKKKKSKVPACEKAQSDQHVPSRGDVLPDPAPSALLSDDDAQDGSAMRVPKNGNGGCEESGADRSAGPSGLEKRSPPATMAIARTDSSDISRCGMTESLDLHLDSMDSELDSLKELLNGEGYSLDANTLLGLFNEDPYSYELPMPLEPEEADKASGNELMAYNTSNMDLVDMLDAAGDEWILPGTPQESVSADKVDNASTTNVLQTPEVKPRSDPFSVVNKKK